MKKIILLCLFFGVVPLMASAQFKLSFRLKTDSTEVLKPEKESSNFFFKALKTIEKVKAVLDDPSKIEISLGNNKGEKESLKDYLRRKKLIKKEVYYYKPSEAISNLA
jgi:hypothetical protein